ncbi:hypothetical protein EDE05_11777 [Neorhizobium sp. R1-B]|uniref:hypothetical protein n=1 Tax=Neorhizobium sp. R1-B TaxID=2485162 RepID=UPI0010661468|nr:hypothetical protein [Neorhizobium sp. R1-B]TDX76195.1 hypothetical protein EDE05_11777 [Neorhizobium sp. R1-B]
MASPWKFLARLVSPRRQQRPENGSADDVTPELLAIVTPSEIPASEGSVSASDGLAVEELQLQDQADETLADLQHSTAVISAQGTADVEGSDFAEAADAVQSESADTVDPVAAKPAQLRQRVEPGRRRRGKKAKVLEVVPPTSADVPTVNDNTLSLDEEIQLLREQLASKLQLQNAQLKKMLERFEH